MKILTRLFTVCVCAYRADRMKIMYLINMNIKIRKLSEDHL